MKRPWMPLYIADFIRDTTHVGPLIKGAYVCLIMHYWTHEGLPDDDTKLRTITGLSPQEWRYHRGTLKAFFRDGWKHKRIEHELAHAVDVSNKRAAATAVREALRAERERIKEQSNDTSNDPSDDDTLHTSHFTKEESRGAEAPPLKIVSSRQYAFAGRVVRLDQEGFDRWKKTYHLIPDITATLQSADDYYSETPPKDGKWFFPVSRWLEKEHNRISAEQERQRREARSF